MIPELVLARTIIIKASAAKVWEALTDPAAMVQWMSNEDISMAINADWKVGGLLTIKGDLHGIVYENKGVVISFEPERALAYSSWSSLSQLPDEPAYYNIIAFKLTSSGQETILTFTQEPFATEAIYKHSEFYWYAALSLLKKRVE